ncbi:MAG: hypothetical protein ABSG46_01885 [Candidatus Binataceae bacterium]|jgi:hypothetical protein
MELRLLASETERDCFAHRLREVRAMRGAGFTETARSRTGEVHLKFASLYGLFDDRTPGAGMLGGFAMHDLAMFGQSFPRPDLTHLPPESVFECGELWALAAGAAPILRHAGWILAGELQAAALLLYPIFKPWNLSGAYDKGFERMGEPVEWPYARTLGGGKIWVQPMVSQGEALQSIINSAKAYSYQVMDNGDRIRFTTPYSICLKQLLGRNSRSGTRKATFADDRVAA